MRTDDDLMAAVRAGDSAAFTELFDRYREAVWRFFRRRLANGDLAADLCQDVFVALLRNAKRYEPRGSFRSYLFGIAFNQLAAARRQQSPTVETDTDGPPVRTADPADGLWIRQALAGMESNDREVLLLREYEGMSYEEIAQVMSTPIGTVRSRLFRAREALRERLTGTPIEQGAAR